MRRSSSYIGIIKIKVTIEMTNVGLSTIYIVSSCVFHGHGILTVKRLGLNQTKCYQRVLSE